MTRNARMTDPQANLPDADEAEVPDEVYEQIWDHLHVRWKARVVKIDADVVWLDVGSKFESTVPLSEWTDFGQMPVVGDEIRVGIDDSQLTDFPLRVDLHGWRGTLSIPFEEILGPLKVGDVVPGRIIRMFEEGFLVRLEGGGLGHMNALYFGEVPPSTIWNETDATFQSAPWRIVETDDYTRRIRVEPA